jgi:hypothetical protein
MPYLLVEYRHDPPLTDEEHDEMARRLDPCLEVRGIRWMRSWLSTDRTWGICEFEAADAESVREAYRSAKVKFLNVRSVDLFGAP